MLTQTERREHGHEREHCGRVRQVEKEGGRKVGACRLVLRDFFHPQWLAPVITHTDHDQQGPAKEPDPEFFTDEETDDVVNAETGDGTVNRVGHCRTETRYKAGLPAFRESPGNAQHVYRAYWSRDDQSGTDPSQQYTQIVHGARLSVTRCNGITVNWNRVGEPPSSSIGVISACALGRTG
jgi:hypothetical protein